MVLTRRQLLRLAGSATGSLVLGTALAQELGRRSLAAATGAAAIPVARGDLRLVLISDLNSSYGSTSYIPTVHRGVPLVRALQPDLVLCGGDMVAGQKRGLSASHLDAMWAAFDSQVLGPIRAGGTPFAPTMGNHDASSSWGPEGFSFALDRERAERYWRRQQNGLGLTLVEARDFPFRYSLRQGPLFAVVIDASSARVTADDWAWADRQLASPEARQASLRLVMGHLPPYGISQGRDRPGEVLHQPEALVSLMARRGVHLYVCGHHHAWYPCRAGGINILNLGAMGSGPRRLLGSQEPPIQTLTVLDLYRDRRLLVESTLELNGLQLLQTAQLPPTLQPSHGPRLERRGAEMTLV